MPAAASALDCSMSWSRRPLAASAVICRSQSSSTVGCSIAISSQYSRGLKDSIAAFISVTVIMVSGYHPAVTPNNANPSALSYRPRWVELVIARNPRVYTDVYVHLPAEPVSELYRLRWLIENSPISPARHVPSGGDHFAVCSMTPTEVLFRVFGHRGFRGQQQAIVDHVLAGRHALVIMPTGGGKSLCYQLPALVEAERHAAGNAAPLAIVISPLIALMKDQFHHRTRADLEDSDPLRRTARAASAFTCPRPTCRLGRTRAVP
jgi:hypothetical protein